MRWFTKLKAWWYRDLSPLDRKIRNAAAIGFVIAVALLIYMMTHPELYAH